MQPSLNLIGSKYKCILCKKEGTVTTEQVIECANCGAHYTSNYKSAYASGLGVAGFVMSIGTGILHKGPVGTGILALVLGVIVARYCFEMHFDPS